MEMYLLVSMVGAGRRWCRAGSRELFNVFTVGDAMARAGNIRSALSKEWWAHLDSNQGPTGYEPVALAN